MKFFISNHCKGRAFSWFIKTKGYIIKSDRMFSRQGLAMQAIKKHVEKYYNLKIGHNEIRIWKTQKRFL